MTVHRSRFARKAELIQTLVYFDGPQVALLRTDRNMEMLAVHVDRDDMSYPMFACEVSKNTLRKYMSERFDLRYVFTASERGLKHYFFDWETIRNKLVDIDRASSDEIENDDFYPEAGFFSRSHTKPYQERAAAPVEAQKYKIDGSWEASDFSRFYGRISDLYAIMSIASENLVKSVSAIDLEFAKQTISQYLWRGGGSYVNFYDSVFERIQSFVPLNVRKIRYASPGYIELNGGKDQLSEIESLMTLFEENGDLLKKIHGDIDKRLKNENLKRAEGDASFVSHNTERQVFTLSFNLAMEMGVENPQNLYEMCGKSTLIFAKIVLSFYRRGRDLHKFYAEGRVQTSEEAIKSVENA